MSDCVTLDIHIDTEAPNEGVKQLVSVIKPNWNKDNLQIKALSGGFSGKVFKCFCTDDLRDCITIRCQNAIPELAHILKQTWEYNAAMAMSVRGYFPPIHACFSNGFCFQYIHGRPICTINDPELRLDEHLISLIAIQLANLHTITLSEEELKQCTTRFFNFDTFGEAYTRWDERFPTKEEMAEEENFVADFCSKVSSPTVICHGDCQTGNIIKRDDKDEVVLIDWEVSHLGPRAGDLAYLVYMPAFIAYIFELPIFVPEENVFIDIVCRSYQKRLNDFNGKSPVDVKEEDIYQLKKEVKAFELAITFKMMTLAALFPDLTKTIVKNYDEKSTIQWMIDWYFNSKVKLTGIRGWGSQKNLLI